MRKRIPTNENTVSFIKRDYFSHICAQRCWLEAGVWPLRLLSKVLQVSYQHW